MVTLKNKQVLLGFSPLEKEKLQDTMRILHVSYAFGVYGKMFYSVAATFSNNKNVNKAFAERVTKPFVQCADHRFDLAVKRLLERQQAFIDDVQRLTNKLIISVLSVNLRIHTPSTLQESSSNG